MASRFARNIQRNETFLAIFKHCEDNAVREEEDVVAVVVWKVYE